MISPEVDRLARIVWDYHHLHHRLEQADVILVQGSPDLRVAARGAALFLEGFAPVLALSGGLGNLTRKMWDEPEADKFARIARAMGVPDEAIVIENASTNTGENVRFTQRVFAEKGFDPETFILVQKPYMERRTYATFRKVWPEKRAIVTSPELDFDSYPTDEMTQERVVEIMVCETD